MSRIGWCEGALSRCGSPLTPPTEPVSLFGVVDLPMPANVDRLLDPYRKFLEAYEIVEERAVDIGRELIVRRKGSGQDGPTLLVYDLKPLD